MIRADKLKKLSMPKKPAIQQEADLDLEMMGEDELEDLEAPAEMADEAPELAAADALSDDELLAELKRRGLMAESSPVGAAAESDIVVDEEQDYEDLPEGGNPELSKLARPAPMKPKQKK